MSRSFELKSAMLAEPHFVFETLGFGITPALALHPDTSPQICEEMSSL